MPKYINSKNQEVDTSNLEQKHLERAYDKAVREGHAENAQALQEEIDKRNNE